MSTETSKTKWQKDIKDRNKTEQHIQELWNNSKIYNICIMGMPEEVNETIEIFEAIMTEKSLK